ncbi:GNAT family N-acetyltransferase [Blastococcus sp. TF02A-26]|uniref:GNAT family N-acetyltransferase n=1 Tax=Blastococcus sp. TF02A-26 TaxID=2250577 RepID=UPI000DEB2439|nr:GNAT family N-acetyltransferase [Blastococcus sp. TF02A-26]RBY81820.1 GNAT family N-acetyltransferase [Blastococcus sp. TF02A-26]
MDDSPDALSSRLRPVTAEEWPAFSRAMYEAFGSDAGPSLTPEPPGVAELDRSLSLWDGDRVAATAGIYTRELTVPGAVVPCAGVTWVTVSPTHRRRGVLTAMMRRQLTELHEQEREPVAALWASEGPIYGRFGYAPAAQRGGLSGRIRDVVLRPDVDLGAGVVAPASVEQYRAAATSLHERVRRFVPGNMTRTAPWWDRLLEDRPDLRRGAGARRYVLHTEPDGTVTGYAAFRVTAAWDDETGTPDGTVAVEEVRALGTPAYAALWRYLLSVDLMRRVSYRTASVDEPLLHLVTDPRALQVRPVDALWVRLVDVGRALAARRYPTPINLVFQVRDRFCPWNDGRWALTAHPAGGFCAPTDADPDIVLGIEELSAAYLGGVSLASLQAAGRVTEVSPGAVTLAATAFSWPVTPWCPDDF